MEVQVPIYLVFRRDPRLGVELPSVVDCPLSVVDCPIVVWRIELGS